MQEDILIVEEKEEGTRLDTFLSEKIDGHSRSFFQKLIEEENVLVNDKIEKSKYKVSYNDKISIFIPPPKELDIMPEDIPLDILYEDEDLIVVNKEQGMVVHPAPGNYQGTLVNALLHHCRGNLSGINGIIRPGIVHRIDKDTSGVLVVAKNDFVHVSLAEQIKEHSVNRRYITLVHHNILQNHITVEKPIGRHPIERKKMAVVSKNGKHAITHFTVLERFGKYTLLEAKLETGRTHQIRVHMSSIGHPVVGDPLYGVKNEKFDLKGQALHARILGFIHPKKNEYMEFSAPLPEYFENLLEKVRKM